MTKLWNDMLAILKAPFVGELDIPHLFLLVGLVMVFAFAWAIILEHMRVAASEI